MQGSRIDRHRAGILLLVAILAPLTTLRLYSGDEIQYFVWLRSAVFDHDLDFTNEYRWFYERDPEAYAGFANTFLGPLTPAGRPPNNAPIGCAILWAPAYLFSLVLERLGGYGPSSGAEGYSQLQFAAICLASMLYAALGLVLTQETCRRFASDRAAFWSTILVWFGTNVLFYMYVTPPMSHASSFFAASLFLWAWLRADLRPAPYFVLGLLGGLLASVRWQDALFLAVPATAPVFRGAVHDAGSARTFVLSGLALGAGFLLAFTPQLLAWKAVNGSVTPFGVISVSGRFDPSAPHLFGIFFSSFHGLFVWSPVLLPALAGLVLAAVSDGRGRALLLTVALQLYLLSGYAVAFGHGFGQRLFVSSLPATAIGLAIFGERFAGTLRRPLATGLGILCVWWNLSLIVQHATGMIPRNEGVPLGTLLHNQLVEVPRRVPAVAARYLFARSSFYEVDPSRQPGPGR